MRATYTHDCRHCVLIAIDAPRPGEPRVNAVDVYRHAGRTEQETLTIRRFSSEPCDYRARHNDYGHTI